jgi:hypothetical protein
LACHLAPVRERSQDGECNRGYRHTRELGSPSYAVPRPARNRVRRHVRRCPAASRLRGSSAYTGSLDAHQNRPTSAQKDGPSKCAGWSTARNLVGLECSLRRTTSDESRGAWQRILSPLLWFDPAGGLLPSRPQNISSRRAQQSSRTAGTPTERLARRFQAAP